MILLNCLRDMITLYTVVFKDSLHYLVLILEENCLTSFVSPSATQFHPNFHLTIW